MGKTFIRETYNEYFRRLKQISDNIDELRQLAQRIPDANIQNTISAKVSELQNELSGYAVNLETTGVKIFEHVG